MKCLLVELLRKRDSFVVMLIHMHDYYLEVLNNVVRLEQPLPPPIKPSMLELYWRKLKLLDLCLFIRFFFWMGDESMPLVWWKVLWQGKDGYCQQDKLLPLVLHPQTECMKTAWTVMWCLWSLYCIYKSGQETTLNTHHFMCLHHVRVFTGMCVWFFLFFVFFYIILHGHLWNKH